MSPLSDTASSSSQISSPITSILSPVRHSLTSPLPQSFVEKTIGPTVTYEILVRIVHGRLRTSSRITTNIAYFPASRPFPASERRREAYEAGGLLPSPMDDPEGWFAFPTLTIYGMIYADQEPRHTKANCTLYLAQPLSYTRGSVIPCFLTISSNDEQLLPMLSSPKTPIVRLLRCIRHPVEEGHNDATSQSAAQALTGHSLVVTTEPTGELKLVKQEVGRARWWSPSKDVVQTPNDRHLEGEIHLNPSLPPNCDFQSFQIEYAVEMLSFQTDKFEPEIHPASRKRDFVLLSSPVEITTLYRQDEPIPTVYSEPPTTHIMRRLDSDDKRDAIFEEEE